MANLLQVSSAFGRAMESVDRVRTVGAIFPALRRRHQAGQAGLRNALAAAAEGYAFPTNLDLDQPVDGLAPASQADLVRRALEESWTDERLQDSLREHAARRRTTG
jgi:hypothetical protein